MARRTWSPHFAADLATSDLLPGCPDCGDLAFPGATVCEACGAHLLPSAALMRECGESRLEPCFDCGGVGCETCAFTRLVYRNAA